MKMKMIMMTCCSDMPTNVLLRHANHTANTIARSRVWPWLPPRTFATSAFVFFFKPHPVPPPTTPPQPAPRYQRQLWDPDTPRLVAADDAAAKCAAAVMEARLLREAREGAVARAEAAVMELRGAKAAAAAVEVAEQVLQSRRSDLLEATSSEQIKLRADVAALKAAAGPDGLSAPLESALLAVTGHVGVLLVDSKFSALGADGSPLPAPDAVSQVFLPEALWELLERQLEQDSPLRALVVVSALPITDTARAATSDAAAAGGPFDPAYGLWSAREKDQERLLALLFDWKVRTRRGRGDMGGGEGGTQLGEMDLGILKRW